MVAFLRLVVIKMEVVIAEDDSPGKGSPMGFLAGCFGETMKGRMERLCFF